MHSCALKVNAVLSQREAAKPRMIMTKRDNAHDGQEMLADPDAPLVRRAAQGDENACRLLMDRHLGRILSVARRMLGNDSDAEDVAQEVFIRIWRHAAQWEPGRARFETWIYRVTVNLCYDRLRKRKETTVDEMPEIADGAPSVIERHAQQDIAQAMERALAALPERQRLAIVLCHYQGMTNIEAAAFLELTVEALESLLARGRRALRSLLREEAGSLLEAL